MMHSKFVAGTLIGAAVSMILIPEMNRSTKKKMKRTSRRMKNAADTICNGIIGWIR